jgi:hypothetical protein
LIFALAAIVAFAAGLAACGGDSDSSDESPKTVIENATLEGIQSADLDLTLGIRSSGSEKSDLDVSVSGPFQSQEGDDYPELDIDVKATGTVEGDDVDFEGGLVLLPNSAFVSYQGTEYEVDPTTFSFAESTFNQALGQGGGGGGSTACQESLGGLDVSSFTQDLKNEGSADVGGTETTKLSGRLDLSGAVDQAIKLSEDPACSAQLRATGSFPSKAELESSRDKVEDSVKTGSIEIYVGDDDIVRRIAGEIVVEPKGAGGDSSTIEFDLTLNGVNEDQEIAAPDSAQPLGELFAKLGVNPLELLGAAQQGDFEGLLEQFGGVEGLPDLGGKKGGSGSGGGGGGDRGGNGGGGVMSFGDCAKEAATAADLQKCAEQL